MIELLQGPALFWLIALLIGISLRTLSRCQEELAWNEGRCRVCGCPLIWFGTASDGADGYKCSLAGHPHGAAWVGKRFRKRTGAA